MGGNSCITEKIREIVAKCTETKNGRNIKKLDVVLAVERQKYCIIQLKKPIVHIKTRFIAFQSLTSIFSKRA